MGVCIGDSLTQLIDEQVESLASDMRITDELISHEILQIVDEYYIVDGDTSLVSQKCLTRVMWVHRIGKHLFDPYHMAEC